MLVYIHVLVLSLFPAAITSSASHSNLNSITALTNYHNFGGGDAEYNFCIRGLLDETSKDSIFGPFYKFTIEFTPVSLPCSPCRYTYSANVTWTKIGFENELTQLGSTDDFKILQDDSLFIKKPRGDDFGTYYCILNGFVANIWSLEVEPFKYFDIVKPRHWKSHQTTLPEILVSTKWDRWSACSKCDTVGKRHRVGNCYVEVYKTGLSCNLFLLLHPEVQPEVIEVLTAKPVLLIGYCKIPCSYFDTPPEILNARIHPKILRVYHNEMEMRADLELKKIQEKNRGKRGFNPGKPTGFETLTLFLLLTLQMIIVVHICRNRRTAK